MLTTVTPKYVNQPREGKKVGNIKMGGDKFTLDRDFLVPPNLLSSFHPGVPINIEYSEREGWRTVTSVIPIAPVNNGPGLPMVRSPDAQGSDKDEHIFVCGLLNQMAAAGNLLPDYEGNEVAKTGRWLRAQYREIWKPMKMAPQPPAQTVTAKDEMEDSIPF